MASASSESEATGEGINAPPTSGLCKVKNILVNSTQDLRTIFFYPLVQGLMTGIGFTVGKHVAEVYFFGKPDVKTSTSTTVATS